MEKAIKENLIDVNVSCLFVCSVVKDFVLIGQHTCPKTAMKEIDELYTVFKGISKKWKMDVGQTPPCTSSSKGRTGAGANPSS